METIDVQARSDLYKEIIRAKQAETSLGYTLEMLSKQIEDLKTAIEKLIVDPAPTLGSNNLVTSGAVYDALRTLDLKIDSIRP